MSKGVAFEKEIQKLFVSLGKKHVQHDVHIRFGSIRSQFDLCYGLNKKHFVECKYRSSGLISLDHVATFAAKLHLHAIPYTRGVMVTNKSYAKRAKTYAKQIGVRLIDGKKISSMKRSPLRLWHALF